MKTFFILCALTIVNSSICKAQFADTFTDGNYTANPTWTGNNEKFIVNDAALLKLAAPAEASSAFMATPSIAINHAHWEFYVQMDFNPSNVNFAKVYLVSDRADLSDSLRGYFIKVGNTNDEISLYRQDGKTEIKLIDGQDKILNTSTVKVKIKVLRDASGNWQLFSDIGNTGIFKQERDTIDNTYLSSFFFGLQCTYTATRSNQFYFDDFVVTGEPFTDVIPPVLQNTKVISQNQLELNFSENLDSISAKKITNYFVSNGLGNPASVLLSPNRKTLNIFYHNNFPNAIECKIEVSGVKDVAGNIMTNTEKTFMSFKQDPTAYKDIIITEIFADPNPTIGLPDAEYVEIFNRSTKSIDLTDFILTDGGANGTLPSRILLPGEYLILTATTTKDQFNAYGNVTGLTNFPTLNNSADSLVLKDVKGITLDAVYYADTWYKDDDKKQGGWSLEIIDLTNICAEADNWIASEAADGGTPGKQNATNAIRIDNTGPSLLSAIPTSAQTITLQFNEKLDKDLPDTNQFLIDPFTEITSALFADASLTKINLTLNKALQPKTFYNVAIKRIYDCIGNAIRSEFSKVEFGLPEMPDSTDVVINEILFNPRPTGVDFVEVYNRSSKFINLKNCFIASLEDDSIINAKAISIADKLLKPLSYLVLTENGNILKGEYIAAQENNFCQIKAMPSFNDDQGSAAFISEGKVIDHIRYYKDMHSPFIKDEEGVSLERIDYKGASANLQNWKSASSTTGFATPGYKNANAIGENALLDESVKVDPLTFIPISGSPNFTQIIYKFDQGGYIANVEIYNTQGQEIKQIVNNALLGTEGFFTWDGDDSYGNKARVGYYVISFEVFNQDGVVKTFRKFVAVATNFN